MSGPADDALRVIIVGNHQAAKQRHRFAGIFVEREIEALRRAGVMVDYFDVGLIKTPLEFWRRVRELRRAARAFRADLIHAQYGAAVGLVATLGGRPAIVTFSGTDLHRGGGNIGGLRRLAGRLVSNTAAALARRVICVSDRLRQNLWVHRRSAAVIARGVDLGMFEPAPQEESRRLLGWDDAPTVLFAGGRDPINKGQALAEAAFAHVKQAIPNAVLRTITAAIDPPAMLAHYRAADVMIFTSLHEGSPNSVKEALACNLPIVSVPVGDVEERLAGVTPSAVTPRDPRALGEAIVEVLRTGRRSNGRDAVAELTPDRVARRIIEVYRSVV
jgi:teichuronic acid biosynthesis glycosyltransferase TuaC